MDELLTTIPYLMWIQQSKLYWNGHKKVSAACIHIRLEAVLAHESTSLLVLNQSENETHIIWQMFVLLRVYSFLFWDTRKKKSEETQWKKNKKSQIAPCRWWSNVTNNWVIRCILVLITHDENEVAVWTCTVAGQYTANKRKRNIRFFIYPTWFLLYAHFFICNNKYCKWKWI